MNQKPRMFIASSTEGVDTANAVHLNLRDDIEGTVWCNGTFELSSKTTDSLIQKTKSVDFALFIFSADDVAIIRDRKTPIVRDNVLFELGLFIGAIGLERCFILKPKDDQLHFPTDLSGITIADYDSKRSDGDLASAVNPACTLMKNQMKKLGLIGKAISSCRVQISSVGVPYTITQIDEQVLMQLLGTKTEDPSGYDLHRIKSVLGDDRSVDLSVIQLEKIGCIKRSIQSNEFDNCDYYAYHITDEGIELLLNNKDRIFTKNKQVGEAPFDDDAPF